VIFRYSSKLLIYHDFSATGVRQSSATKRKLSDANFNDELISKIDVRTDHVMDLNKKYENGLDEIGQLRKSNEKIEKITYSSAKSHKYVSSDTHSIYSNCECVLLRCYCK
jgi:DNA repair ATPase RecN